MPRQSVLVLDFGGQYNQLIARRVRECHVYCEVKPYTISLYDYQRRRLEEKHGLWPVRDGDTSTWALSEGFYKKEIGFSIEETSMQFLEV